MSERYWPKDMIGNEVRKGALIHIPATIARVHEVVAAGSMEDKDGNRMALQGHITLIVQAPFDQGGRIDGAVVVCEPELEAKPALII